MFIISSELSPDVHAEASSQSLCDGSDLNHLQVCLRVYVLICLKSPDRRKTAIDSSFLKIYTQGKSNSKVVSSIVDLLGLSTQLIITCILGIQA